MNARESAFIALYESLKESAFVQDTLNIWKKNYQPSHKDEQLAKQIAMGSLQRAISLDYFVLKASKEKKLNLKVKEKALLRTAVFQMAFLDRVPRYAIVDETIKIAKKYFNRFFVNFLNAVLRKMAEEDFLLPQGKDANSLSIAYSYPKYYIEILIESYGLDKALEILDIGNTTAITMARLRNDAVLKDGMREVFEKPFKIITVPNALLEEVAQSPDYYIQNVTPAFLIGTLAEKLKKKPQKVLDVCASPGGKTLALHDLFKDAHYYVNDVSEKKLDRLKENFDKCGLTVYLSCQDGRDLKFEEKFDLIVLDVPCSNTGVLNKRAEARFRVSQETSLQLEKLQLELLDSAKKHLVEGGQIWYMTCSILSQENEILVEKFAASNGAVVGDKICILPNVDGWDGGFGCIITF